MTPPKRLARIAGGLYLLVGIFGGFAEGFVEPKMYVAGNAAATAGNVVANAGLVRMGVVADLLDGTFFVFPALALYLLLKHVHKSAARAMLVLVALAAAHHLPQCGLRVRGLAGRNRWRSTLPPSVPAVRMPSCCSCSTPSTTGSSPRRSSSACGWCRSGISPTSQGGSPSALGVVLVVASVCYLVDLLAAFLIPDLDQQIHAFTSIVPAIAEPWMVVLPTRDRREGGKAREAHPRRRAGGVAGPRRAAVANWGQRRRATKEPGTAGLFCLGTGCCLSGSGSRSRGGCPGGYAFGLRQQGCTPPQEESMNA